MCARSSERGFTLPELVAILVLLGVLAAVALPKLDVGLGLREDGWHDEVLAALRTARQTAVSHRRLVCAQIDVDRIRLSVAAANPATSCTAPLAGPDGGAAFTTAPSGTTLAMSAGGAPVALPATLHFQPSGRVTSDGAGATAADRRLSVGALGPAFDIVVVGETGHVR